MFEEVCLFCGLPTNGLLYCSDSCRAKDNEPSPAIRPADHPSSSSSTHRNSAANTRSPSTFQSPVIPLTSPFLGALPALVHSRSYGRASTSVTSSPTTSSANTSPYPWTNPNHPAVPSSPPPTLSLPPQAYPQPTSTGKSTPSENGAARLPSFNSSSLDTHHIRGDETLRFSRRPGLTNHFTSPRALYPLVVHSRTSSSTNTTATNNNNTCGPAKPDNALGLSGAECLSPRRSSEKLGHYHPKSKFDRPSGQTVHSSGLSLRSEGWARTTRPGSEDDEAQPSDDDHDHSSTLSAHSHSHMYPISSRTDSSYPAHRHLHEYASFRESPLKPSEEWVSSASTTTTFGRQASNPSSNHSASSSSHTSPSAPSLSPLQLDEPQLESRGRSRGRDRNVSSDREKHVHDQDDEADERQSRSRSRVTDDSSRRRSSRSSRTRDHPGSSRERGRRNSSSTRRSESGGRTISRERSRGRRDHSQRARDESSRGRSRSRDESSRGRSGSRGRASRETDGSVSPTSNVPPLGQPATRTRRPTIVNKAPPPFTVLFGQPTLRSNESSQSRSREHGRRSSEESSRSRLQINA